MSALRILKYKPKPDAAEMQIEIPDHVDWTEVMETMRRHFHPGVPLERETPPWLRPSSN